MKTGEWIAIIMISCSCAVLGFMAGAGLVQRDCRRIHFEADAPTLTLSPGYMAWLQVSQVIDHYEQREAQAAHDAEMARTLKLVKEVGERLLQRRQEAQKLDTTLPYRPPPPGMSQPTLLLEIEELWDIAKLKYSNNSNSPAPPKPKYDIVNTRHTNSDGNWYIETQMRGRMDTNYLRELRGYVMGGNLYRSVTNQWFTNDNGLLRPIRGER